MNNNVLVKDVMSAFFKVKRIMMKEFDKHFQSDDIKPSESMLLFKIGGFSRDEKVIVTDIVNALGLAPSTVSLTLNSLEDHGYIKRSLNKDNRREIYVSLTDKGKATLEDLKKKHQDLILGLTNFLGKDDTKKLGELLEKMAVFLESKENK